MSSDSRLFIAVLVVLCNLATTALSREASFLPLGTEPLAALQTFAANATAQPDADSVSAGTSSHVTGWEGTPPGLLTALLPGLALPTASPVLNALAVRLLTTPIPDGPDAASLTNVRIDRLLTLGAGETAWQQVETLPTKAIDELTLRRAAATALIGTDADALCQLLPDLIKAHDSPAWQQLQTVCALRAKDFPAAQVTLNALHEAKISDDLFFDLAEKNVISGNRQLPRQMTPLSPVDLALVQLTGLPLRAETYAKPDAVLIPALLRTNAADDKARLVLAERAARKGLIDVPQLLDAYRAASFTPDELTANLASRETGPRLRALLAQSLTHDRSPPTRLDEALRFLHSGDGIEIAGVPAQAVVSLIADIAPAAEYNRSTAEVARLYLLANKPDGALPWLRQARVAAAGIGDLKSQLQNAWPLIALNGLVADSDYDRDFDNWLTVMLQAPPVAAVNPHQNSYRPPNAPVILTPREAAAALALLLAANGQPVPDSIWLKLAGAPVFNRQLLPDALTLDRLHAAAAGHRLNETLLYALLAAGDGAAPGLPVTLSIIRALRLVGLNAEATQLAVETAAALPLANPP